MTKFAYNNATHAFIKMSSFEIMLSYSSRMSFENSIDERRKFKSAMKHAKNLKELMIVLKKELSDAQVKQVKYKNRHIKVIEKHSLSDFVYLNEKNIRIKRNKKLK